MSWLSDLACQRVGEAVAQFQLRRKTGALAERAVGPSGETCLAFGRRYVLDADGFDEVVEPDRRSRQRRWRIRRRWPPTSAPDRPRRARFRTDWRRVRHAGSLPTGRRSQRRRPRGCPFGRLPDCRGVLRLQGGWPSRLGEVTGSWLLVRIRIRGRGVSRCSGICRSFTADRLPRCKEALVGGHAKLALALFDCRILVGSRHCHCLSAYRCRSRYEDAIIPAPSGCRPEGASR